MKIRIITITVFFATLIFSSCEDVLDKRNLNAVDDIIWDTEEQSIMYLNGLYESNMPQSGFANLGDLTEEYKGNENRIVLYGQYADIKTQMGSHGNEMHINNYRKIRDINICIEGVNGGSLSDTVKSLITGQAYFFRAYRYWRMVRMYGGVPMIMYVQDPYYDNLDVPRETTKRSIELIVEDLNRAIDQLPEKWRLDDDFGRITKGAAAAFKGRVLLTWASPLFNRNNDLDRWEWAYEANKTADSILTNGAGPKSLNPNFENIFTDDVLGNSEAIIFRSYDGTIYTNDWESEIRPESGGGDDNFKPTWELVKAFPMANGKFTADPTSGFDSVMYWLGRDPRFYHTVAFTGSEWPMAGRNLDFKTDIVATYSNNNIENINNTNESFLCRKASDSSVDQAETGNTTTSWIELRYAEVLLNLAECANEVGEGQEAIDNLIKIRKRAGIEEGDGDYGLPNSDDKEFILETIMNERLAEFAFEGKRYWDLRRRLMYRNNLGKYTKSLNGTKRTTIKLSPNVPYKSKVVSNDVYNGLYSIDTIMVKGHFDLNSLDDYNEYFTVLYEPVDLPTASYTGIINYHEQYDFYVIPKAIIESSPAVEQNIGWDSEATFDPLAE